MTASRTVEAVAFDLMDTLVRDPWRSALRAALGDRLEAAMRDREPDAWPRFETGALSEDDFWATLASHRPDVAAARQVRLDETAWLPGMRELVVDLQAADVPLALASNYPIWFEDLEHTLLGGLFETVVVSYRVGVRKPDPRFYDAVAAALETPHEQITFVDDRAGNVEGASATGMVGLAFTDADDLRLRLRAHGLPV